MISGFPFSFIATASHVFKHYEFVELKASKQHSVAALEPIFSSPACAPVFACLKLSKEFAFTRELRQHLSDHILTPELARAPGGAYRVMNVEKCIRRCLRRRSRHAKLETESRKV